MAKAGTPTFTADMRIVVFHGKEQFLIEEYTRLLKSAIDEAHGESEVFRFDGEKAELAVILDELRSYGLMQTHKIVIVDTADEFMTREDGSYRRSMERYAENPVDHATLVLRGTKWNKGKFDKAVVKVGVVAKCDTPTDAKAVAWCMNRVKKAHNAEMELAAANRLVERLGTSLNRLDSELAKLAALVEPNGKIAAELVLEVVGKSREEQAWEIQEVILTGRSGSALTKIRYLLEVSLSPKELIMWSMIDLARKLHTTSRMLKQGISPGEVSREVKLWGASKEPVLRAARKQSPHQLAQLLQHTIKTDRHIKTGLATAERSLECLAVTMADTLK